MRPRKLSLSFGSRMSEEQRYNLKFLTKLGKTPTESLKLLQEVYGDGAMSRPRVFEWHKRAVREWARDCGG